MIRTATLTAIPTKFRGRFYRSRLEARWSVFFDGMGIKFEHEPEGFELSGERYLPDFYLPQIKWFAEIKPTWFTTAEENKSAKFVRETGLKILLLDGPPDYQSYYGYQRVLTDFTTVEGQDYSLDVAQYAQAFTEGRLWGNPNLKGREAPEDYFSTQYREAVRASLSERFGC